VEQLPVSEDVPSQFERDVLVAHKIDERRLMDTASLQHIGLGDDSEGTGALRIRVAALVNNALVCHIVLGCDNSKHDGAVVAQISANESVNERNILGSLLLSCCVNEAWQVDKL
jgi:hypothetical protein